MRGYGLLGGAVLLGLAACQPAETPQQMQARIDAESAAFAEFASGVAKRWEGWEAAGQADSIANMYMEQGREMPPNGPAFVGRDAIRANAAQQLSMGKITIHITSETAVANGALGINRGSYDFTFVANKGMENMGIPPADSGKYLMHWHKVNGNWQIAELIYNSNLPLPTPAPAPARRR